MCGAVVRSSVAAQLRSGPGDLAPLPVVPPWSSGHRVKQCPATARSPGQPLDFTTSGFIPIIFMLYQDTFKMHTTLTISCQCYASEGKLFFQDTNGGSGARQEPPHGRGGGGGCRMLNVGQGSATSDSPAGPEPARGISTYLHIYFLHITF